MFGNSTDVDQEVYREIYRRLYREAEPGMDYDDAEKEEHGMPHYKLHYLDDDRISEIIENVCDEENVSSDDESTVHSSVMLGAAPMGHKDSVRENRREAGLEPINRTTDDGDLETDPKTRELPTAAYEVWCIEDGEEKMALERGLPEQATVNNELVRRSDVLELVDKLIEYGETELDREAIDDEFQKGHIKVLEEVRKKLTGDSKRTSTEDDTE